MQREPDGQAEGLRDFPGVFPGTCRRRPIKLVRNIRVEVQRRFGVSLQAERQRQHRPQPVGGDGVGVVGTPPVLLEEIRDVNLAFLLRCSQAGSLRKPVLDLVHLARRIAAPADGGSLAVPEQCDAAECVITVARHLVRGKARQFVEEVLEIGTLQDEVLDLVHSGGCWVGREHGALSPGA
ncbi:hypothetical protein D9M72_413590 [compost metagenome]